jgi:hypothetical protein
MSTQQSSPGAGKPVMDLRPVTFQKTDDDGRQAVFQAQIGDIMKVPGEPVLKLTVTMASSAGNEKAAQEIEEFLSEVHAGFAVTAPQSAGDQDDNENPDAFNVDNVIRFETELIRSGTSEDPVGVTVIIQVTIEGNTSSEQAPRALVQASNVIWKSGSILQGTCHQYPSNNARKMTATVTSSSGSATVSPGAHRINQYDSYTVTAQTVTVCGVSQKCDYTIREQF